MLISSLNIDDIKELNNNISNKLDKATSLELAANIFTKEIYNTFEESIVLIRLFTTIQFSKLPKNKQKFAHNLCSDTGLTNPLDNDSFVLTLFGSYGKETEWCDISNSVGHQAIPLVSEEFVKKIPMISSLLEELHFNLSWIRGEKDIVAKRIGDAVGVFFVKDAPISKDSKGRKIISDQDFVNKYDIKSVFGIGGKYHSMREFMTTIIFTKETLSKHHSIQFFCFSNLFKDKTRNLVSDNLYFE